MPATSERKEEEQFVLGVDGCRNGWVAAILGVRSKKVNVSVLPNFGLVLSRFQNAAMIIVDMPIGLRDEGPRACETMARKLIGPRRSSVFPAPRRPMLALPDYAAANAWGKAQGCGLTKQAWHILSKIREIDEAITPAHQARLGEGHPEVAFTRLNSGMPCVHRKRSTNGLRERAAILETKGFHTLDTLTAEARGQAKSIGAKVADDDVYDACALALTARARLEGRALRLSDEARDARGLVIEIWG